MEHSEKNPIIGAEIFIEPGQTASEIEGWFKLLKENGMTVTRIRMFENYMLNTNGDWDYTLFDTAFRAGEKYGIKIYANLFPSTVLTDIGGFKFPKSEQHLSEIAVYIKNLVSHFKQFSSLYGWVPINEPGSGSLPTDDFTRLKFMEWKQQQQQIDEHDNGYVKFDFSEREFLIEYNTWFLQWLTNEIHKYDPNGIIHVNNHDIFKNVAEYDFPRWSSFLTTLGGSAHASWHFGYFNRSQYAVAMSANSEIIRSGAKGIPWLMTELQGGNNTYSGRVPMCPTKEEIAQWLWITIGAESKGAIFWCLNPRSSGQEAGEWAMVDFQDQPTDRLLMASLVAKTIDNHAVLFADAHVIDYGIDILYTRQSIWIEKELKTAGSPFEGRDEGAVIKSALAYFEALSEMGINAGFGEISEYDFSKENYHGRAILLAHQISIPTCFYAKLTHFVRCGGKLILEGLSGFYNENAYFVLRKGFPLVHVCGAQIKEYKALENDFSFSINDSILTGSFWKGTLALGSAIAISELDNEVIASRNFFGEGEMLWLPTLSGLSCRKTGDYSSLARFLNSELKASLIGVPVIFSDHQKGMLMKTLKSGENVITILVNKSADFRQVRLQGAVHHQQATVVFASNGGSVKRHVVAIAAEETMVIKWQ